MNGWGRVRTLGVLLLAVAAVLPAVSSGALRHGDHRRQEAVNGPTVEQLPFRIRDTFNGTSANPMVWFTDQGQENAGTTVGVGGGSLWLTASSSASSGFHDGITTRCRAMGDFDARIRFTLSSWPAGDNVSLAVNAYPLGNTFLKSSTAGNAFGLYLLNGSAVGGGNVWLPASAHGGLLWMSRRGAITSSYFRTGTTGNWNEIGQWKGSTVPVSVDVAIWNVGFGSQPFPFGGQPVSVQVESFKLDAAGLSC
jgi:hypothetical protein